MGDSIKVKDVEIPDYVYDDFKKLMTYTFKEIVKSASGNQALITIVNLTNQDLEIVHTYRPSGGEMNGIINQSKINDKIYLTNYIKKMHSTTGLIVGGSLSAACASIAVDGDNFCSNLAIWVGAESDTVHPQVGIKIWNIPKSKRKDTAKENFKKNFAYEGTLPTQFEVMRNKGTWKSTKQSVSADSGIKIHASAPVRDSKTNTCVVHFLIGTENTIKNALMKLDEKNSGYQVV